MDVFEFRGVDNLYFAKVLQDDENGFVCATPKKLAPVAEVGKTTESSSEAHYYDNKAMIVINSEGADTITITVAPPGLDIMAELTGRSFDPVTGMLVDNVRENDYYAIMYRTKGTDGKYRYVSRLKGQFGIPDETNATENDGTDTNNIQLTFTGIYTEYEFTKGRYNPSNSTWSKGAVKGVVVDSRYELANLANFFAAVQTPDTVSAAGTVNVTGVTLTPSTASIEISEELQLTATVEPASATDKTVAYASSDNLVATVTTGGKVTGVAAGSAVITVTTTDGSFTDVCAVTVTS
jgi:phi13 family phage major tail protein